MAYTTIDDPEAYFQVELFTGNGGTQAMTFDGDTDMQPDLVVIKQRGGDDTSFTWFDSVRGAQKALASENDTAEATRTNAVSAFDSDGFTLGDNNDLNASSETYVAWCWKANGSGSINTAGSIDTIKTSANTTSGFSIINYGGTGSVLTFGHGLGAVPKMLIFKSQSQNDWYVHHTATGVNGRLILNMTNASADNTAFLNQVLPTSTLITLGTTGQVNDASENYICYAFTPVQGFSSIGSYAGNANANGTFVYTGFRPAFILVKGYNESAQEWAIFDNKRDPINPVALRIQPSDDAAESGGQDIDFLSNGFKIRVTGAFINGSYNYIYAAFAEAPFVNSNGVPGNAR